MCKRNEKGIKWTKPDILNMERKARLKLINGITGIKPANLIGTISAKGNENLAVFSSVVHLGSNPALVGFIARPKGEVPRNTLENILAQKFYTINHVPLGYEERAHYTSAKFPSSISEFEKCNIPIEYIDNFEAPFVKDSKIKFGLEFKEKIDVPLNGTSLIIGEVQMIVINESRALDKNGYVDLEASESMGIAGLNSYYSLQKEGDYPYVRIKDVPNF